MQTLGIGVDIIKNSRIKKSIINKNFINRVFSHEEITESKKKKNKISFFSKRFAAKEAFSKALGTGFRETLNFKDISISNNKNGKPSIKINNKLHNLINKKFKTKKINVLLSISDRSRKTDKVLLKSSCKVKDTCNSCVNWLRFWRILRFSIRSSDKSSASSFIWPLSLPKALSLPEIASVIKNCAITNINKRNISTIRRVANASTKPGQM